NAAFQVVAQGTPPLHYQWFFNGSLLSGATQPGLSLVNVRVDQTGNYSVVVSDNSGSITSRPARLTVVQPLGIVRSPQSVMTVAGASVSFTVQAQGSGTLSYQWFFNTAPLAGANTATLTLDNLQPAQAGTYAAVVSDANHSVTSAPAVLTILSSWN